MESARIGIRAHSGWGAVVAVSGAPGTVSVIERRRIAITDPKAAGAKQPYHFAASLALGEAERHLAECAAISERLAFEALGEMVEELRRRGYRAASCAILLASGRDLPPLPAILASHSLIHAAEGEFFRQAFRTACARLAIAVTGIRERDLDARGDAPSLRREIAALGRALGPPWTADQKNASLAALLGGLA